MKVLEALKILEDATLACKDRPINTPEVNEALDTIAIYVNTDWRVKSFRDNLDRHLDPFGVGDSGEGQQQQLRVHFGGIYRCVREALILEIDRLGGRYMRLKDPAIRADVDRLKAVLAKLPAQWVFRAT